MRNVQKPLTFRGWRICWQYLVAGALGMVTAALQAQPNNDNFANAEVISHLWGSVTNDLSQATVEAGEPSHAGFPAANTVWYKWTATNDGTVQLDLLSSPNGSETVLAVYQGTALSNLRQVAANDDIFPLTQANTRYGQPFSLFTQPFNGPSSLKFDARAGEIYYFVVGAKTGTLSAAGPITLGWAYHPSGVFRFATEEAVRTFDPNTLSLTTIPLFNASEWEALPDDASTYETYYQFGTPGMLVTVTRLAGSSGRMLVDYATEDVSQALRDEVPALAGVDYTPVAGTLVFDDYEMTKRIVIPIQPDFFEAQSNRNFAIVLSNARPDPLESSDVSPPRIDGTYGRALVRILDNDIDPVMDFNFVENTNSPTGSDFAPTNSLFNFSRVALRTTEDVNSYWTYVSVWVNRFGTNREAVTLNYRINNFLGAGDNTDPSEEDNNYFSLQPGSDYATPLPTDDSPGGNSIGIHGTNADFQAVSPANYSFPGGGTLSWGQDDFNSKRITFVVTNDTLTEFNEDWHIFLYRTVNNATRLVGNVNETDVTILFDDQDPPAGSVDQMHNPDFGASMVPPVSTVPPNQAHPGADSTVYALALQPDDKTVIAGAFQSFNAVGRNRIARLNLNGSLDTSFNPGSGANNSITALARTTTGKYLIGGGFTAFNGTPRAHVARLNNNGSLDTAFTPGSGPDGWVWAIAEQPDGKVIIAGEFTSIGGNPHAHIARLNTNGVLDATFSTAFNPPDGNIWAIALQPDGKIIIGGEFYAVGGLICGGIARLNSDGTLDASFNPGAGTDGVVYSLALLADNRILVGGLYSVYDSNLRNNLTRLNSDGSIDLSFDPASSGADGAVYSILPDATGLYVGGSFLNFNGTHRRGLVRLYPDGTVDTGFLDTAYNQFAGLHRARFSDPPGTIYSLAVQTDGKVMIGGSFEQVGGGQASALVRPEASADFNLWVEPKARDGVRNRKNVARLIGGATPGPGNISLTADSHTANENQGSLSVSLTRTNGTLGFLSANFEVEDGLAKAGLGGDYVYNAVPPIYLSSWRSQFLASQPAATTRMHSDGLFGESFVPTSIYGQEFYGYTPGQVVVTIQNDNQTQGDRNTTFRLRNPSSSDIFYLGGENIPLGGALGFSQAPLNILDDDNTLGELSFQSVNFVVNENVTNAVITIVRNKGSYGSVSCQYSTYTGGTAGAGADYVSRSGPLNFANGQTVRTFTVPIIDDSSVEPDETIFIRITNPGGGATFGVSNAVITIIDNDTPGGKISFSSASYGTNESAGAALVTVQRSGSSAGTLTVQVAATNGTASSPVDFTAVTNLVMWTNGDVAPKTFVVPLIDDVTIEPDETVNLRLLNATLNSLPNPASLGALTNATLTISNDDNSGKIYFSSSSYSANEHGGPAVITLVRQNGDAESVSVSFAAYNGTAVGGFDFTPTNGTLTFGPGELAKSFTVPIRNNNAPDLPRFITLAISNAVPAGALGSPSTVLLNIVDDESVNEPPGGVDTVFVPSGMNESVFTLALQSDGKILAGGDFTTANQVPRQRIVRLGSFDGTVDPTFAPTANGTVRAIEQQTDGRVLLAGAFTQVDGIARNHVGRVNANGSLDTSFDIGSGTDNPVFALTQTYVNGERKVILAGAFTVYGGITRNGVVRVNENGSVDETFAPASGANGIVYAVAAYPTNTLNSGKILIGGEFTTVNGVGRNRIARLNSDGSLDLSFDPGLGAGDSVRALAIQSDGRVLVGGSFTNFNGTPINRIARLNNSGSLDSTFVPGQGANDTVSAILVQGDTRIVLGGQFTRCNGVTRNHLTRLNSDGSVDPTINFGTGPNNFVAAVVGQSDGKIIIGGGFTEYDGQARQRIARIYGGSIAGSGTFEFVTAVFSANENATNATVTVRRRGGTAGQPGSPNVTVDVVTDNITATNGIHFAGGTIPLIFPPGEVLQTFDIPVMDDFEVNADRVAGLALTNIQPTGPDSAALGNQPSATLNIINDDSAISFGAANFTRNENSVDGLATIQIIRTGSTLGSATVDFTTTTNGTATVLLDYLATTNSLVFAPGETVKQVTIPILNDLLVEGDETVTMQLTNAGGSLLLAPTTATLTIVDDDFAPGKVGFATPAFTVTENAGTAQITLIRTNGRSGVVSVQYFTTDITATTGIDYTPASGSVVFGDGETNKVISVPISNDFVVENPEIFSITLTNFTGGAALIGASTAPVTIQDDDVGITFSAPVYLVGESGPSVSVTVLRINGSNGVATVNYSTSDVTAQANADYTATSGTLSFANGETIKSFTVPILEDSIVEGDETFGVTLSNPSVGIVLLNSSANVSILDNDTGLGFGPAVYVVDESGTNIMLTVVRTNANTVDPVTVSFGTTNGTATASADYVATAGVLTFTNGEASKTITVPILEDTQVEGDETFTVALSNPTGGAQFTGPTLASVTIVDNDAGLAFSSDDYAVLEGGVQQTITVLRTGITNSLVTVNYSTSDGTATNGQDYLGVSGLLTFTNGEVSKTFSIQVIDDTLEEGAETVLVKLSNPTGQAALLNPNAATLTIVDNDGSLVLPAGSLLTAESGPANGAIDPGETVSGIFAIRNVSGFTTENLTATLLATNGVVPQSSAQNYGALASGGASVSRPFTFKVNGTNGAIIGVTFQLQDGINNYGRVTFNYLLGTSSATFSNLAAITINDPTNNTPAAATPYPSTINVAGLGGVVSKVVVTLTNVAHVHPNDIDILMAGPAAQRMILMSDAGGGNQITNVTLTFDDAAGTDLPFSNQIVSGTNRPTNYLLGDSFPQPAPPAPYDATLAAFNGSNPNGAWSLYVVDDTVLDVGSIARGWFLSLTTSGVIPAAADLSVTVLDEPDPGIVGSNLVYSILVTNHGPWNASGIVLTNFLPTNAVYVSSSASTGTIVTNAAGELVWTIGALTKDQAQSATVTVRPTTAGIVTSTSSAAGNQVDPNPDNSTATAVTTVANPTADLVIGIIDSPDPLNLGGNLTYSLFVTNNGPATATGVSVTNTLPPTMTFVSATPGGYTVSGRIVTFTNLGNVGSSLSATATITVHPTAAGTFTNSATTGSGVIDPLKGNNTAAVKSIVIFPNPPLATHIVGSSLVIAWPVDAADFVLESTTNLTPPVIWTPVTVPPPVVVGSQKIVTNSIGTGDRFFRLRAPLQ